MFSENPSGEFQRKTFETKVPDKHDGVINIHSALWSEGDAFRSTHNRLFDDAPYEGGYNHFELRNYKRAYELEDKNGNIGFLKGYKNPAMGRVEVWVEKGFRF